jgi:hypothetical protein
LVAASGATLFMVNPRGPTQDNEANEEGLPAKDAKGREREIAFSFRVFGVFGGLFPGFLICLWMRLCRVVFFALPVVNVPST